MMKYAAVILSIIFFFKSVNADQLKAVAAIVNHGDTIPLKFYPNDPNKDSPVWDGRFGQLSNLGEQQSYAVGQWLLKRYILNNPFVSLQYNASQIYTFSEDRDPSLMSAECILAGFLPPVGDEIWNRKLLWRPTPVHTAPLFLDYAVGRGESCPRLLHDDTKLLHGRFYRTHNKEAKNVLEYITAQTGQHYKNIAEIPELYNILEVEQNHNLTLPQWTESVFPDVLGKIVLEDSIMRTKNLELARFTIGPLFYDIITAFQAILTNNPKVGTSLSDLRKFKLYVANNTLIYDTLHALKVPSVGVVPFSATLIFELWGTDTGLDYVKLLYRSSPALHTPIQTLKIGGCKSNKCPYQTFNATLGNIAVTFPQWQQLCNSGNSSPESNNVPVASPPPQGV